MEGIIFKLHDFRYLSNLMHQNFLFLKSIDILNGAMRTARNPVSKSKASLY